MHHIIKGYIYNDNGFYIEEETENVFINQKGLADLCGITSSSLTRALTVNKPLWKTLESKGLTGLDTLAQNGIGKLYSEEVAMEILDYYAGRGKKEAMNFIRTFARIGFRTLVHSQLGFESKKKMVPMDEIKTFPHYERTISDWLEEFFEAEYKTIEREYRLPNGQRVDFYLDGKVIVEVKRVENWPHSVIQALRYKNQLKAITGRNNFQMKLFLFGSCDILEQREIRQEIKEMKVGIKSVHFLTDVNLLEDRR